MSIGTVAAVELVRVPGGYTTPDGRFRVQRNTTCCWPLCWWAITETTVRSSPPGGAPNLRHVREWIAQWLEAGE